MWLDNFLLSYCSVNIPYICMYVCICMYMYVYIYVYVYGEQNIV